MGRDVVERRRHGRRSLGQRRGAGRYVERLVKGMRHGSEGASAAWALSAISCDHGERESEDDAGIQPVLLALSNDQSSPEITSLEVPDLQTKDIDNAKKLKIRWNATDPNDDELTYNIYCKKEGWKDWVLLEENQEKNLYDWDTTGMPSGLYQIKIVASDRKDNAAEDALSAERISAPVPVTHLPPNVTVKLVGIENGAAIIEASASDGYVRLTEASFAVDGKRWINVFPTDGLFDSKTETFRFKTDALRPGTHVLVVRVQRRGNVGSGDLVINKE